MRYPDIDYSAKKVGKCKTAIFRGYFEALDGFELNSCAPSPNGVWYVKALTGRIYLQCGLQAHAMAKPHPILLCGYSCHLDSFSATINGGGIGTAFSPEVRVKNGFDRVTTVGRANALEEHIVASAPHALGIAEEVMPQMVKEKYPDVSGRLEAYLPFAREYAAKLLGGEKDFFSGNVWNEADHYSASAQIGGKGPPFRNIYRFALAVMLAHSEDVEGRSWLGKKAHIPGMPIEEAAFSHTNREFIEANTEFMQVFQALVSQILWSPDHYFDELVMKLHDPNPEWLEYDFEKHLARANREKRDTGG